MVEFLSKLGRCSLIRQAQLGTDSQKKKKNLIRYLHVGGLSRREEFKLSTHKVSAWDIWSQLVLRQTEQAGSSIQKVFDIVLCSSQKSYIGNISTLTDLGKSFALCFCVFQDRLPSVYLYSKTTGKATKIQLGERKHLIRCIRTTLLWQASTVWGHWCHSLSFVQLNCPLFQCEPIIFIPGWQ